MSLLIDACVEGLREGGDGNGEGEGEGGNGTGESGSGDGGGGSAVMSGIRNRRTRTRNYKPLGGPSSQTMQNPDYQSDDDATGPDSWSNPDMEPVPMAPLPTAAPPNQAVPGSTAPRQNPPRQARVSPWVSVWEVCTDRERGTSTSTRAKDIIFSASFLRI